MKELIVALLAVCAFVCHGEGIEYRYFNPPPTDPFTGEEFKLPELEEAKKELPKARMVAFSGVGFAGTMPKEIYYCYSIIEFSEDAENDLVLIFKIGTREAKVYALWSLAKMKSEKYQPLRDSLSDKMEVSTMFGCIGHTTTLGEILNIQVEPAGAINSEAAASPR